MPIRMSMVCSRVGSSTITGWKRRSRAASRSMYLRYSSSVVAPMHWSSPPASGGLRRFAAWRAAPAAAAPAGTRAAGWRRLEHGRGAYRACGGAGAGERVELVDEEDRVVGVPELLDDLL